MADKAVHAWVSGRVQGVNFRHATLQHAKQWKLTGWTRNLPDGRVEVLAFGAAEGVDKLIHWLHRGPLLAHVTNVEVLEVAWEIHEDFTILR